ncbi:ACP S-malonyltransferase [Lacimicrobium alkaliphilum]|uniref:Malonyl CoA-acyl carrier protein transacylase n=1 Tax=Lacimicrobium alkaliphilum TaxID=1526571 RepID=A0ABQ1RQS8_9ALTE|nr:ACP S-malonyltransferase [Lacimicrobium alkaliphilum]GGD78373.1 malonyl CoA-acyl carrier protein transacylase [Lacimicrobium alkaliphilum]
MSKTAFVFPGQGSQSLGMLSELAADYPQVEETFAQASEVLGYDLWHLVQQGPEADLNQTQRTQPALLAASVAVWRVAQAQGVPPPDLLAGHSLGEYSALVCAGVLDFADGIKLTALRGEFMQQAVPAGTGAMAAIIGLDDDKVEQACAEAAAGDVVSAVNYNSPGQVVIAGQKAAVERAMEACKAAGAKRALPLPVSVPSHCALMKPAAEKLAAELAELTFNAPVIPLINNVDVETEQQPERIKDALVRQLFNPVRWTESMQKMVSEGVTQVYELGPGKVLTGLTKRIDKSLSCDAVNTPQGIQTLTEKGK